MLNACIQSLALQELPPGWTVDIVVVDNESSPNNLGIVEGLSGSSPIPLIHLHEPRPGIPFARNHALDVCLSRGAEWIAFIDDDEIAETGWLLSFVEAAAQFDAEILQGAVDYVYPASCKWIPPEKRRKTENGAQLTRAATNNVMFKSLIVRSDGFGLRFDEELAFSGGEDIDFFFRAKKMGARIVYVAEAKATETVPVERCTFKWRMKRHYRTASTKVLRDIREKGYFTAARHYLPESISLFARSLGLLLMLPFLFPMHRGSLHSDIYIVGRRFASACGLLAGILRLPPLQSYRSIEGR